jgi:hypothetical protein
MYEKTMKLKSQQKNNTKISKIKNKIKIMNVKITKK